MINNKPVKAWNTRLTDINSKDKHELITPGDPNDFTIPSNTNLSQPIILKKDSSTNNNNSNLLNNTTNNNKLSEETDQVNQNKESENNLLSSNNNNYNRNQYNNSYNGYNSMYNGGYGGNMYGSGFGNSMYGGGFGNSMYGGGFGGNMFGYRGNMGIYNNDPNGYQPDLLDRCFMSIERMNFQLYHLCELARMIQQQSNALCFLYEIICKGYKMFQDYLYDRLKQLYIKIKIYLFNKIAQIRQSIKEFFIINNDKLDSYKVKNQIKIIDKILLIALIFSGSTIILQLISSKIK